MARIGIDVIIGTVFKGKGLGKAQNEVLKFAAATSAALAGVSAWGSKMAIDFERGFAQVNTIVGVTGQEFDDLRKGTLAVAADSSFAIGDITKALYDLVSAGVPAGDAIASLDVAAKAGTAGAATLTDAVSSGVSILNAYGLEASELTRVFDTQFQAVKRGQITFQELAAYQGQLIPQARALGVSYEEMFGALAFLTTQGQRPRIAVTNLANAFASLIQQRDKFAEAGIDIFERGTGEARSFLSIVEDLKGAMEDMNDAQRAAFMSNLNLSQQAINAIQPMIGQFETAAESIGSVSQEQAGAMTAAYSIMEKTVSEILGRLGNKIKTGLIVNVGDELLPQIRAIASAGEGIAEGFGDLDPIARKVSVISGEVFVLGTASLAVAPQIAKLFRTISTGAVLAKTAIVGTGGIVAGMALFAVATAKALTEVEKLVQETGALNLDLTLGPGGGSLRGALLGGVKEEPPTPGALPEILGTPRTTGEFEAAGDALGAAAAHRIEQELTPVFEDWQSASAQDIARGRLLEAGAPALDIEPLDFEHVESVIRKKVETSWLLGDTVPDDLREAMNRAVNPRANYPLDFPAKPAVSGEQELVARRLQRELGLTEEQAVIAASQVLAEEMQLLRETIHDQLVAAGEIESAEAKRGRRSGGAESEAATVKAKIQTGFVDAIDSGLASVISGAATFRDAMANIAAEIQAMLLRIAIRSLFSAAFSIPGLQHGGMVRGGVPGIDSVPILAQAGEIVVPKRLSSSLVEFFSSMAAPYDRQYAGGGLVAGGGLGATPVEVNVLIQSPDVDSTRRYVQSSEFVDAVNDAIRTGLIR